MQDHATRRHAACLISNGLYGAHRADLLGLPRQLSGERVKQHLKLMMTANDC